MSLEAELKAGPIDLAAQIGAKLDRISEQLDALGQRSARYLTTFGAATTPSSVPSVFALTPNPNGPPAGRLWSLEWVAVYASVASPFNPISSLFWALCIGRAPVQSSGGGGSVSGPIELSDVVAPSQIAPGVFTVPDKTFVRPQEDLYVVMGGTGMVGSTIYCVSCGVIEMPNTAEAYFW